MVQVIISIILISLSYSYVSIYIESKSCDRRDCQNWLISGKFPDLPLMKDRLKPTNADYKKGVREIVSA